jgi:hypothetical protein
MIIYLRENWAETWANHGTDTDQHRSTIPAMTRTSTGGAKGTRTPNPLLAKQVRYLLRHGPG